MATNLEKEWTILIYANGNNDLEPEMHQAVENIKKAAAHLDVRVVIELGRANHKLIEMLRKTTTPESTDNWSGVRRYLAEENKLQLLANLKDINMAHPEHLYEFIKWGVETYPAKRYMLILGGHGYQFVGTMTDYMQKAPYIMGIPEMAAAIDRAGEKTGRKIDLLLLDICYFNFIEVIYEFGKRRNHAAQNILTYVYNGPIEGLPYNIVIDTLQKTSCLDINTIIKELIDHLSADLVAFTISHALLAEIKAQFNQYARELAASAACFDGSTKIPDSISVNLFSLIIYYKRVTQSEALISVAKKPTNRPELIARYSRLGFAQQNHWTYLLSNKTLAADTLSTQKNKLQPLKLQSSEVYSFITIMNPVLPESSKQKILEKLFTQRNWKKTN